MEEPALFIEKITINEVRHLKDVEIPISDTERKHLILTGKNGSGKTSVLEEIKDWFSDKISKISDDENISGFYKKVKDYFEGVTLKVNLVDNKWEIGNLIEGKPFIFAHFDSRRKVEFNPVNGVKKIRIVNGDNIGFKHRMSPYLLQFLVNLKAAEAFAIVDKDLQDSSQIKKWFDRFESVLKDLFADKKLSLEFDRSEFIFNIVLSRGEKISFDVLSDGFSSYLDIFTELILRMDIFYPEDASNNYNIQGIVLIDEIETHLHIDLQKKILPFLTSFFPKIQFIVSTHSPFVISSLSNAVVYDLENHTRFEDLSEYPIDGIVEGYFDNNKYSAAVTEKIKEYEVLTEKDTLTEIEKKRRYELFQQLSDVSGKLAPELKLKFQQIQLKRLAKANG